MSTHPIAASVTRVTRSDHDETWIDLGIDPMATERIGEAVAALARDRGADLVVSWNGEEDVVLAHVTAHALDAPRIVVHEDMGLMSFSRPVENGRAVLVATRFSRYRPVEAVRRMLAERDVELALAVELLSSDDRDHSAVVLSLTSGH